MGSRHRKACRITPATTPFDSYNLFACADDAKLVPETDETNNCVAAAEKLVVTGPDFVETSVSSTPTTVFRGLGFKVTDKVQNNGAQGAGASTTRYCLSLHSTKHANDILLTGSRAVAALGAGVASEGTVTVTVPATTPFDSYNLFACADDAKLVPETDETNNCVAAAEKLVVTGPDLVETQYEQKEFASPACQAKEVELLITSTNVITSRKS